jgi:protein TonB
MDRNRPASRPSPRLVLPAALLAAGLLAGCEAPPAPPAIPSTAVKAIDAPPPQYPLDLACDGIGGKVELMITVGTEGTVTRADMQRSSGQAALDNAALEAVRGWRFRAATYNGQPVETQVAVPITFNVPPTEPEDCYFLQRGGQAPPPAAS